MTPVHELPPPRGPAADLADGIRGAIPVLDTPRLRLRAMEMGDFVVMLEILNGPRGDGIGGPMERRKAWFDFTQMQSTWTWRGHGWWTITDCNTGKILGFTGLGFEPGDLEPELGYFLTDAAEGRGYASEAARAVQTFARERLRFASVVSYINKDNARSVAVAERIGAVRDPAAETALGQDDTFVYRHHLTGGAP
ncbi:MAG: GNAT family N-acetyltransferase [Pseudomonadota bacterium]